MAPNGFVRGEAAGDDQVRAATTDAFVGMASTRTTAPLELAWDDRPQWFRELVARSAATGIEPVPCAHLAGPMPFVVWAEQPDRARCRGCAEADWPERHCLDCGRAAGGDGIETVLQVQMMLVSLVRCPSCEQRSHLGVPATFTNSGAAG